MKRLLRLHFVVLDVALDVGVDFMFNKFIMCYKSWEKYASKDETEFNKNIKLQMLYRILKSTRKDIKLHQGEGSELKLNIP